MQVSNNSRLAQNYNLHQAEHKPAVRPQELSEKPEVLTQKDTSKEDKTRKFVVGAIGYSSYKTQFNIIMNGMLEQSFYDKTLDTLKTIKDIQKQNNLMKAYAYFHDNPVKQPKN